MAEIIEIELVKCGEHFVELSACRICEYHNEHKILKEATEAIPAFKVVYCLKPRMREVMKIKRGDDVTLIVSCAQIKNNPYINVVDCKKCDLHKGSGSKTENSKVLEFILCGLKTRKNISFHIGGDLACLQ